MEEVPAADEPAGAVAAVAALGDRLRAELYRFVRRSDRPVTRDEAAVSTGISRRLAAFHLEKLVSVGLLRTREGRAGRTATVGRSPKLYEPSGLDIRVQLPERRYELLAEILLDALSDGGGRVEHAIATARGRGRDIGEAWRPVVPGGRVGPERGLRVVRDALARCGYEPAPTDGGTLVLRNCPFHQLAERHRELTCSLNHAFCSGILEGVGAPALDAHLVPAPQRCCVEVRASGRSRSGADRHERGADQS